MSSLFRSDDAARPRDRVGDYLRVLYRRRWLGIAALGAVVAGVAIYNYQAPRIYEARASVLIDFEAPRIVDLPQVLDESPAMGAYAQTQQELLVSRALVQRTVRALMLWTRPGFGPDEQAAIGAMQRDLQVVPVRGTRIVHVRFRARTPGLAAEVANAHARQYVEQSLEKRFLAAQQATEWLETQLGDERRRVEQSEAALQAFREQHDGVSLDEGQNIVVQKLADLNAAVTRAKTSRIEKEAQYREIAAAQANPSALDAFPAILGNSFIEQLKGSLAAQQREYAQLSQTLGDLHPTLVEKRTALESTEKRLAAEIGRVATSVQNAYQGALAEEQSLMRALDEQKREALALDRRGIQYAALQREAESVRQVYQTLLQRVKETGVARELRATNVHIVDEALPPTGPVLPRTRFNLAMALLTGVLLAVGLVFGVELLDERIKAPADLETHASAAFLGLVPEVASRRGSAPVTLTKPDAPPVLVEAFRTIRTNITATQAAGQPRVVLIASASPHEGKTHVASNLAIALAATQQRVLLIDADMRRPCVHDRMNARLEPGLSDLLTGTATLKDAVQPSEAAGLNLISAGLPSDRAPELLASSTFAELLNVLEEHFDWVVIDSPPTLTVTDARILASRPMGVVLVVGSGMTTGRAVALALEELQRAGGVILGTVLNRADVAHHPFYFEPYATSDYLKSLRNPIPDAAPAALGMRGRAV